ncbi:MAG: RdgB/HAM1 family non-canonical purine NTP pyrophosphatase [Bacteroidetes bacterium]|jgi:XTP/dITP diphosphohydrolase|nr:RdgB/HAM1 family non-canonical purine NTP pyrophosphatase [Bacteroidota bacterium]
MKLIFASHNQHKTKEIQNVFQSFAEIKSLSDIGFDLEIEENGLTLKDNAEIKAKTIWKATQLNCFADDTGLMVAALNNEPGVHSARYAGLEKDPVANNKKLLQALNGKDNLEASFVTVICLIINREMHLFEGKLKGTITHEPKGSEGFGYDPIFIPENDTRTLAQLSLEEKNRISHRGKAFAQMLDFIKTRV